MPRYAPRITAEDLQAKIVAHIKSNAAYMEEFGPSFAQPLDDIAGAVMYSEGEEGFPFAKIYKDWEKVDFSLENVLITQGFDFPWKGFHTTPDGLSFLGLMCGGDWEVPLLAIMYHDGKTFRGYVPTKGNCFVASTKQAFGTAEYSDAAAYLFAHFSTHPKLQGLTAQDIEAKLDNAELDPLDILVDKDALLADIGARIVVRG